MAKKSSTGIEATVLFEPEHFMTATGNRRIGLIVENGGAVPDEVMADLQSRTALLTYPEGTQVAASMTIRNNTKVRLIGDRLGRTDEYAYLDVTPVEPLEDRWYELVVWDFPTALAVLGDGLIGKKMADGSVRSRFSPTSHPVVRALLQSVTPQGKSFVTAEFSEPIDEASRGSAVFTDLSGKRNCRQMPTKGASPRHVTAECEGGDVTHAIDFSLGGLRSRHGVGLREHSRGREIAAQAHYGIQFAVQPGDATHREWRPVD